MYIVYAKKHDAIFANFYTIFASFQFGSFSTNLKENFAAGAGGTTKTTKIRTVHVTALNR